LQNFPIIIPKIMVRLLITILCYSLLIANVSAQPDSAIIYTEERPLVFEDSESIWPYSFLNDEGEPEGYCIDLIHLLMQELHIPYVVRLKNHQETLQDLKDGKADLILGLGDVYEEKYGHYGSTTVTLLTQSVATPKSQKVTIKSFRDLKNQQVIVKDSGLCHHLMVDYGWGDHVIVSHDIAKSIQDINATGKGQIVWNTLTLKWLINHYQLDNLMLTPVNMPHGETKFLSNNQHLLDLIDKTYAELCATNQLSELEKKWLYPDREASKRPIWEWYFAGLALLFLAVILYLFIRVRQRDRSTTALCQQLANQFSQIAKRGKVRFWAYLVKKHQFVWYNQDGHPSATYDANEFMKRYSKEDAIRLTSALERLVTRHMDDKGHEEQEETLELKAKDMECGDQELHDFVVDLTVLRHTREGKPLVIVADKKDITKEHRLKKLNAERSLRYLSVFYNDESAVIYFNGDGILMNANPKASELFESDIDEMVKKHVHVNDLFFTAFTNLEDADGHRGFLTVGNHAIDFQMKTVHNDKKELIGLFVFCV